MDNNLNEFTSQPTQPLINNETPTYSPRKSFPWLTLVLFLVFVPVTGFLFWQNQQLRNQLATSTTSLAPSASTDPTAGWQTYTNQEFSFSFRYPQELKISEDKNSNSLEINLRDSQQISVILLLIQEVKDKLPETNFTQKYNRLIGGINWTAFYSPKIDGGPSPELNAEEFQLRYEQNGVQFVFRFYGQKELTERQNQILSTFKFTNQTTMTKKHFTSTDKFFGPYPYPQELTSLTNNDLVGFACSPKYSKQADGSFVFYNNDSQQNQTIQLENQNIISYLKTTENEAKNISDRNSLLAAMTCDTEDGRTLVSYEITPGGGGAGASAYYGFFQGSNTTTASIPMENGAYFGCGTILAITKSNVLYIECGAGDGGSGSKSLYRVSLAKAYTSDLLYKCTSTSDNEGSTPNIKCGKTQ